MGFLDKVKNMFIEEIEENEPVKKEVVQVEIPVPKKEEEPIETVKEEEPIVEKREEKFVFPVYFDDKDFERIEQKEEKVKPQLKPVEVAPVREAYGIKKEEKVEKKIFKPTPIISPVYGVLDKNYRKEEIKTRKIVSSYEYRSNEKVDIDDVRKKAYGTLEDDLENSLFQKTSILFNNEVNKQQESMEDTIDIFEEQTRAQRNRGKAETDFDPDFSFDDNLVSDNMIEEELNRNYEEESKSSYIDELNDSDLFNLIDSMYESEDNE